MMKKTLATGALAVAAVPTTAFMVMPAGINSGRSPLQGAWQVEIIPDKGDPFININTFDHDGAVVNVSPVFGAGVGESYRVGPNAFHIEFHGFNDLNSRFLATGTVSLDGPDTFSGDYVTGIYDLDGTLLFEIEGTLIGNRL